MIATRYYDPLEPPVGYNPISYVIHNFSDLCDLLEIHVPDRSRNIKCTKATVKALLAYKSQNSLPKTIQYHSGSSQLVQGLMYRAIQHWCCISFKIVPIELELIKNNTPKTILYCVAAISIATISTQQQQQQPIELDATTNNRRSRKVKTLSDKAMDGFKKDIAFCFYKRACNYLQDVIFPDDEASFSVVAIQCYFCLSYTANLLRLPGEQRTWHYLACDMMNSNVSLINESSALRQCWYRWYYIDAWIAIALNQECLLPDRLPFAVKRPAPTTIKEEQVVVPHTGDNSIHGCCIMSNDTLYEFAIMTQFMRRFNRAIQAGTLPLLYDRLTFEAEHWWQTVNAPNLHLRICYFSMRLVILFSLLQHDTYPVDFDLLLDGLNITLEVLQGLQNLKLMNCDQSTYHYMFFAVHQTLKQILVHIKLHQFHSLEAFAKQQFEMDLCILEGTDAFRDDIYQMREIAANIESDLIALGYVQEHAVVQRSLTVFRAKITPQTFNKRAKKSH